MAKRLLDYDPFTATYTYHDYDHATGKTYITTEQNIQPLLDINKANYADDNRNGVKKDWWHVARVPNTIIHKWLVEEGIDFYSSEPWHVKKVKAKLNSNEYRYLRVSEGRV